MGSVETSNIFITCIMFVHVDAAAQGVKPDQIIFTDVATKNEHIRRCALADLCLDTYSPLHLYIYNLSFSYIYMTRL